MTGIRCFVLEPTRECRVTLRRYVRSGNRICTATRDQKYPVGCDAGTRVPDGILGRTPKDWPHEDPRWPPSCMQCQEGFRDDDEWQVHEDRLYCRRDTGEFTTLRSAPVGAMWYADWYVENWSTPEPSDPPRSWHPGPDGHVLVCKTPGPTRAGSLGEWIGWDWIIDARASNCGLPLDNHHACWVRHGAPPDVTVDKDGVTCSAGGGSIGSPYWHGFLRNGWLVT